MDGHTVSEKLVRHLPAKQLNALVLPVFDLNLDGKPQLHEIVKMYKSGRLIQVICRIKDFEGLVSFTIDLLRKVAINIHAFVLNGQQLDLKPLNIDIVYKRLLVKGDKSHLHSNISKIAISASKHHFSNFSAEDITE
ncbi:hypothetical protein [uncultured Pseudoteredinibacter sp.]|uniref:hypothetical protein n=1 Tax=uncultured Pseudoteredinibacter sp. TaxID=1641701 RepID=UPI0026060B00|nr:hypothetical protein [uncultured Pseudoteredinibacter sp.]